MHVILTEKFSNSFQGEISLEFHAKLPPGNATRPHWGSINFGSIYWPSFLTPCHNNTTQGNMPWASCQIRKIAGCACAGNVGNVFPRRRFQRKPLVSDPGMHHGTCVTHVPWCMSGSRTCGDGEHVPGIPSACAPTILRIWKEAHYLTQYWPRFMFPYGITKPQWVKTWHLWGSTMAIIFLKIYLLQSTYIGLKKMLVI